MADLNRECMHVMRCSPQFNTQGYPEAYGLEERWIQPLKRLIHHLVVENPSHWHTLISSTVCAVMEEVPNTTMGFFLCVHEKLLRWPAVVQYIGNFVRLYFL